MVPEYASEPDFLLRQVTIERCAWPYRAVNCALDPLVVANRAATEMAEVDTLSRNILARNADALTSSMTSAMRGWSGINSDPAPSKPETTIELYDFEACPYCRLVREGLTELDLDVVLYPCPKRGTRFRPRVKALGGKTQFPFLVDPNAGRQMYESLDILAYLFETYGKRALPLKWRAGALQKIGSIGSGIPRLGKGFAARPSRAPERKLVLYSFEGSPFARPVRELLCELELPYVLRNAGRTSLSDWVPPPIRDALNIVPKSALENRRKLLKRAGRISIPYLVDPNTGIELADSNDILEYLHETYAA